MTTIIYHQVTQKSSALLGISRQYFFSHLIESDLAIDEPPHQFRAFRTELELSHAITVANIANEGF